MPKIGETTGPSLADGTRPQALTRIVGDVELAGAGSDLSVAGQLSVNAQPSGGAVLHDWTLHGTRGWTPVVINQDSAQAFTLTANNGRGTIAAGASSSGNHRVAYLHDNTEWRDGVVTSLIWGPTADWSGVNAQQGHLHRVRQISTTTWEGIAVWTSIVGGADYGYLHANGVRFNGTTLSQATNADLIFGPFGYGDSAYIDHRLCVIGTQRSQPILWANDFRVQRPQLVTVAATDIVDIADFTDTTFNETGVAVNSIIDGPGGVLRFIEGVSTNAVAYAAVKAGTITPAGVDSQKRWCPFWLASRVIGGTVSSVTIEAKRWRVDEAEPDWGDARVQRAATTVSASVPQLAIGAGRHGLWGAHFLSTSGGAFGNVRMERVT